MRGMSSYIVSARKYRPQVFEEVVGQEHVTKTLYNEIHTDHLAQAFLFCGPRGVGKTTCARILAREINKESIQDDSYDYSFNIFELDAASNNSVEDIRLLNEQVRIPPQLGKYKVYIIDEVHMLSSQAFNAFLKTLEEPPPYAVFILATTERHKILPTILSRCQIFNFSRIPVEKIVEHLQDIATREGIRTEEEALHVIAQKADGALRDALSIFDQMVSIGELNAILYSEVLEHLNVLDYDVYFQITEACLKRDIPAVLLQLDSVLNKGFDAQVFLNGLASHLRDIMICRDPRSATLLEVAPNIRKHYQSTASQMDQGYLVNAIHILNEADLAFKASRNQRLHVEVALLKLCYLPDLIKSDEKKKPELNTPKATTSKEAKPVSSPIQETPAETSSELPEKDETAESLKTESKFSLSGTQPISRFTGIKDKEPDVPSISSINDIMDMDEEDEADVSENPDETDSLENRNVPADELEALYELIRDEIGNEFGGSLPGVLKLIEAVFEENKLILQGSKSHLMQLEQVRAEIVQSIRKHTSSRAVELQFFEIDTRTGTSKPYTDYEKFEAMAQKNPKLREFRDKLGLEFD